MRAGPEYDDGVIRCDPEGITIGWYYPWGAKRIPYGSVLRVERIIRERIRR